MAFFNKMSSRLPCRSVRDFSSERTRKKKADAVIDWNSALYLKFERERTRAARDLLAQIPTFEATHVFDLGCGPGNSSELLASAFTDATIVGLDLSSEMLGVARSRVGRVKFIEQNIESWRPTVSADLIYANASLHFVPNHQDLFARLISYLKDGGWLAVQMPNIIQEGAHALMRMLAADGPWADRLVPIAKTQPLIGALDDYYRLLTPMCSKFDIWETTYVHELDGAQGIVEWFEGSALRPFLTPLSPDERASYLSRYRSELLAAYPSQPNGKMLLRYPRLFFVAQR
jgi:trans-aconitate 2-methyltransferase